jgi:hypothetical protein
MANTSRLGRHFGLFKDFVAIGFAAPQRFIFFVTQNEARTIESRRSGPTFAVCDVLVKI